MTVWKLGRRILCACLFVLCTRPINAPAQITAALTHWQSSQWWRNTATLDMDFVNDRYYLNGTQYTAGSGNTGVQNFITGSGATFTRNSVGTYFDATGTLQTAAANVPRLDHSPTSPYAAQGILIEESRTNYVTYSSQAGNFYSTKSGLTLTDNVATSPDMTNDASQNLETATLTDHYLERKMTSLASNQNMSFATYINPIGSRHFFG